MPPRINAGRLWQRLEALAGITDPAIPFTRRSFSALHADGRAQLQTWFEEAGLAVGLDTAANLIGRRAGREAGLPPLMAGSHSDTVPNGGRFDGIAGVLTALEAAHCLADSGHVLRHPLEIIDFLAEEPSTYGMSCVGSRILGGRLGRDGLNLTNSEGETLAEGIRRMGGDPDRLADAVREAGSVAAYVELHIEQGPVLENGGIAVGIVTGIVGITRYAITVEGRPDHAGNTPMDMRQDALTAAARLVLKAEEEAWALNHSTGFFVGTVGQLAVEPNAANVVPGRVRLTVEFRSGSDAARRSFIASLRQFADEVAAETVRAGRRNLEARGEEAHGCGGIGRFITQGGVDRPVGVVFVLPQEVQVARLFPAGSAVALAETDDAPGMLGHLEHRGNAARLKIGPRENMQGLTVRRAPGAVVEVGVHPVRRAGARIEVLLREQLQARVHHVAADAGLRQAFPGAIGAQAAPAPGRGDEEAGVTLMQILEVAETRIIGAHGEHVAAGYEPAGDVDLVVGPVGLETAGRTAADEGAVDIEVIRLVRCDEQRGAPRYAVEREVAPEQRVGVMQIPAEIVGPDPLGLAKDAVGGGRGGGFHGGGSRRV